MITRLEGACRFQQRQVAPEHALRALCTRLMPPTGASPPLDDMGRIPSR
jgi:hypothetical protein